MLGAQEEPARAGDSRGAERRAGLIPPTHPFAKMA